MFSYNEYKNIIKMVKEHLPILDFSEVDESTKKFCVLRHDIEFSIDRAYELAKIENELDIVSTYTVQLRNNTYNALSEKNIDLIRRIKDLGHHIGLHQNPPLMEVQALNIYIRTDMAILEQFYGFGIDRFAFHRPKKEYLSSYVTLNDKINCYDRKFFQQIACYLKKRILRRFNNAQSPSRIVIFFPSDFRRGRYSTGISIIYFCA